MKKITYLSALFALVLLNGCSAPPPPDEPLRPVRTLIVGTGVAQSEQTYSGDVRARHESPLGFRINGKIIARLVDVGARVQAGQPLAKLDPANVAIQAALAQVQQGQAEADTKRFRELREKNFISQSALDAHETTLKAAQAQAGIARNQEDYATLRADASGVVAAVLADAGQVVGAGTPVVTLARDGEREVAISLPESTVGHFKVGESAEVKVWANEGKIYRGRIRELSPAADPTTRTYPARVTLLDADAKVALGMTAKVSFRTSNHNSLLIPAAAILQQGDQPAVWLVADGGKGSGTVSLRNVQVLAWRDDKALIGIGLKTGERIVESGVHKLHAGETIVFEKNVK